MRTDDACIKPRNNASVGSSMASSFEAEDYTKTATSRRRGHGETEFNAELATDAETRPKWMCGSIMRRRIERRIFKPLIHTNVHLCQTPDVFTRRPQSTRSNLPSWDRTSRTWQFDVKSPVPAQSSVGTVAPNGPSARKPGEALEQSGATVHPPILG